MGLLHMVIAIAAVVAFIYFFVPGPQCDLYKLARSKPLKRPQECPKRKCPRRPERFEDEVEFDLVRSFRWGCSEDVHDTKCAVNRIKQIQQWLEKNNAYRILVTGKMGSGKTTFIRGLTDNFVPSANYLLPHTTVVTLHEITHEGTNCVFYDTPGLKDNEQSSNDYEYLMEMVRMNGEPHLLVFAIKLDDYMFQEDDVELIANISNAFGWRVWKKVMFILTFANMVHKEGQAPASMENKLYFSKAYDRRYMDIVEALKNNNVEREVINSIAVVPVGLISEPKIPADRGGVSWIDNFWKHAYKILKKPPKTYNTPADNAEKLTRSSNNQHSKQNEQTSKTGPWFPLFILISPVLLCLCCRIYIDRKARREGTSIGRLTGLTIKSQFRRL